MPRKMIDSGIDWLGLIPVGWQILRNKVCFDCSKEIVGEKSIETQLLSLTTKGIKEKRAEESAGKVPESYDTYQVVNYNDIVMCLFDLDVSAVFSGRSPFCGMISPAYKVLKCKENIATPEFVDYWFSFIFDGRKFKHYAKNLRYTLNYDEFSTLPMLVPPYEEQKRIAVFLNKECSYIDAVIEETRASIEEYKKLKQSFITQIVTKGINPERPTKESGIDWLGEIPSDWTISPIKRILTEQTAKTVTGEGEQLSVNQKKGVVKAAESGAANPSQTTVDWKIVSINDIVFNKYKAHSGVFFVSKYEGIVTFNYSVFRCIDNNCPKYFEYQFKTDGCIGEFRKQMRGVGDSISPLYTKDLFRIMVAVPPIQEQYEIAEYLDDKLGEIDALITKKELLISELDNMKKSLIYEYVTGKKEVPICQ